MSESVARFGRFALLVIYVFAATPASQLFKLPALIGHFNEHLEQDPSITVIEFFILHYLSGGPRDADYERDMQLPFKTIELAPAALAETQVNAQPLLLPVPLLVVCGKSLPKQLFQIPAQPYLATRTEPPEV